MERGEDRRAEEVCKKCTHKDISSCSFAFAQLLGDIRNKNVY